LFLEVEPVDVRKLDVENQASRKIGLRIDDIVTGRGERFGPPSKGLQQLADCLAYSGVIIYKEDDFPVPAHGDSCIARVL
jgi:hypothetical protein